MPRRAFPRPTGTSIFLGVAASSSRAGPAGSGRTGASRGMDLRPAYAESCKLNLGTRLKSPGPHRRRHLSGSHAPWSSASHRFSLAPVQPRQRVRGGLAATTDARRLPSIKDAAPATLDAANLEQFSAMRCFGRRRWAESAKGVPARAPVRSCGPRPGRATTILAWRSKFARRHITCAMTSSPPPPLPQNRNYGGSPPPFQSGNLLEFSAGRPPRSRAGLEKVLSMARSAIRGRRISSGHPPRPCLRLTRRMALPQFERAVVLDPK